MPIAQATVPDVDLIILVFTGGFAAATLIFWPLLHRARLASRTFTRRPSTRETDPQREVPARTARPAQEFTLVPEEGPIGKHALRKSPVEPGATSAPQPGAATALTALSATAPSIATTPDTPNGTSETPGEERPSTSSPDTRPAKMPTLPSHLFEQRYEAKFARTRKRLARLRAQLNEQ